MDTSRLSSIGEGTLLDMMPGGIIVYKIRGEDIVPCYLNSVSQNIFGCTDEQFLKTKWSEYADRVHPDDRAAFSELTKPLAEMRAAEPVRFAFRVANGEYLSLEVGMTFIAANDDEPYVMFTITDVTEEEEEKRRLGNNLNYDELTGLFTESMFESEVSRMLRNDPRGNYYIIFGDIDRFSAVIEVHGYDTGDVLLKSIGTKLKEHLSEDCKISRISADNFVACITEEHLLLGRIANLVSEGINEAGFHDKISWHAGIYPVTDRSMPVGMMCDRAHSAVKRIKNNGNIHFAFYESKDRYGAVKEHMILQNMNSAFENSEFEVYYQPIFDAKTERPACAEALVRWRRSDGEMVPPGEFIGVFEKYGFIQQLDYYLWEQVCASMRRQLDAGDPVLPVSVNMSRYYAFDPGIFEDIILLTSKYDIDHSLLRFEITESIYGSNPAGLLRFMKSMRDEGFIILLDDYGSGYSTPSSLIDIPFDIIKIDSEFTRRSTESERCRYIIGSVLQMAEQMGVPVVAEGVETREQFEYMTEMSCDYIQGYYFSRPLTEKIYYALMKDIHRRCG